MPKLGIIAGGGALPQQIVDHCLKTERSFVVVALKGQASEDLVSGIPHEWVRLGAAGTSINILHREKVIDVVLAGSVNRPSVFTVYPDLWALKFFLRTGAFFLGDDSLLSALITALQDREGFNVVGSDDLLPDLLVPEGAIGHLSPDLPSMQDIAIGMKAARDLGRRDIGQAVVIRNGMVIGSEDENGTDALLKTITPLNDGTRSGVLVKTAKPQQERRADLPTIGPDTLKGVAAAGLAGIALEAENALILNRKEVREIAEKTGLFVIGTSIE